MNTVEKFRTTMTLSALLLTQPQGNHRRVGRADRPARAGENQPSGIPFRHRLTELRGDTVPPGISSGHTSEHAWFGLTDAQVLEMG